MPIYKYRSFEEAQERLHNSAVLSRKRSTSRHKVRATIAANIC